MLVLSRKKNEAIIITDSNGVRARLTLVEIRGDKARLGFEAPSSITIHREEIQEIVDEQNGAPPPC